jgi:hypothetical protein
MPNYYLQPLPFLVTQDPTKWQGERIRGKRWEHKNYLSNDFKLKQAFRYCKDGLCQFARWGKTNVCEMFY